MVNILSFLWRFAYTDKPLMSQSALELLPEELKELLLDGGHLLRVENAETILISGQLFDVASVPTAGGKFKSCYIDDYDNLHWLQPVQLWQYGIDYSPLAEIVSAGLACRGLIEEPLWNKVWRLGTTGQQSREVYLVRNWKSDKDVQETICSAKDGSLVFHIGERPDEIRIGRRSSIVAEKDKDRVLEAQYYSVDGLINFTDEGLKFDGESVCRNLKDMFAARPPRRRGKKTSKANEVREIIEYTLRTGIDTQMDIAKRYAQGKDVSQTEIAQVKHYFPTKKAFAKSLELKDCEVSRVMKEWKNQLGGFGDLYLLMMDIIVQKETKNNPNPSDRMIDKLNGFYEVHREKIERLHRKHPSQA